MPLRVWYSWLLFLMTLVTLEACNEKKIKNNSGQHSEIDAVAGNEDVARYLKSFKGLGALSDSSEAPSPQDMLKEFQIADDLIIDLALSEPAINQPVEISFDHRGRLWVVQYSQYPYPKGLKIINVDNYLRVTFDKTPQAPPEGVKGADKISFFEDTNGDGIYDKATDAIKDLNIATSVALGRGKIWVLNPPYLLAYPDPDGDGIPNGDPEIHITGFGLQDTHAVTNSLTWGPDGWLYGAQGSTTTSTISSLATKDVFLQGQAIWRYNPNTRVVERFAEGGGNNPFNIEIDEKGRIFSGSNGTDRGPYYKQGGYYIKSWGKHGPLSNPYAFGFLPNMELKGEKKRFTHAFIKYEGDNLPKRYNGKMIAINPLLNYVQLTRFESNGSSLKNEDEEKVLETDSRWFRPVDIQTGPDGAVYIADWSDSRLSHVDPRDTWDKSSGRIWRIRAKKGAHSIVKFDLSHYSDDQLVDLFSEKNSWFRRQALFLLADRKSKTIVPRLLKIFRTGDGQAALEAFWAIHLVEALSDELTLEALRHSDPFVRMWAVRLSGDKEEASVGIYKQLIALALKESNPEVRSQLAATAKRLPAAVAISIVKNLLRGQRDTGDPDIPLQIWWALESKIDSNNSAVLNFCKDHVLWSNPIMEQVVLKRLMQRYAMSGESEKFASAVELLKTSPSNKFSKLLVKGFYEGFGERNMKELPPALLSLLKPFHTEFGDAPLSLALRTGQKSAIDQALAIIKNEDAEMGYRLTYVRIMGEIDQPQSVPVLLQVMENSKTSGTLREAALKALSRYDDEEIGGKIVKAYPAFRADSQDRTAALDVLATRIPWTKQLLKEIMETRKISKEDVPEQTAKRFKLLGDPEINEKVISLWPDIQPLSSSEKMEQMNKISRIVSSSKPGDALQGRLLYLSTCGNCHKLFNEGGVVGPELTGYERGNLKTMLINIVDPNADIREGYEVQRIQTTDGRVLEGRITGRNGNNITIQPPLGGRETNLSSGQIRKIEPSPVSTMPERLLDKMSDQQIRDIFSYIMKR